MAFQFADGGGDREALAGERAFAEARDALVGVDFDVDVILVVARIDQEGLQVGDPEIADVEFFLGRGQARDGSERGAGPGGGRGERSALEEMSDDSSSGSGVRRCAGYRAGSAAGWTNPLSLASGATKYQSPRRFEKSD